MDNRPIAVFDSGLGGLTAVDALSKICPNEDIIYFGDTGRVPYGTRSVRAIKRFSAQASRFLLGFRPKALLVACGTASTTALDSFACGVPVVGVMEPSVRRAAEITKNGKVGLIATPASVRSGAYSRYMREIKPSISLTEREGRLLVPLVEAGRVNSGDKVLELLVEEYCAPFRSDEIDTLILGCTHYPLLTEIFSAALPGVNLINSGEQSAIAIRDIVTHANRANRGVSKFFVSDDAAGFSRQASLFLGRKRTEIAELVDLEEIV